MYFFEHYCEIKYKLQKKINLDRTNIKEGQFPHDCAFHSGWSLWQATALNRNAV
jgi:hypothetical protein